MFHPTRASVMVELAKARQVLQVNDGYGQIFKREVYEDQGSDRIQKPESNAVDQNEDLKREFFDFQEMIPSSSSHTWTYSPNKGSDRIQKPESNAVDQNEDLEREFFDFQEMIPSSSSNGWTFPEDDVISSISSLPETSEEFVVVEETSTRKRKKVAQPEEWQANCRRIQKQAGKPYVTASGQVTQPRKVLEKDCSKCMKKCTELISKDEQLLLRHTFWDLGDHKTQNQYILNSVVEKPKASTQTKALKSRRTISRKYFVTVNGVNIQVCMGFFLTTLGISEKRLRIAMQNKCDGNIAAVDRRGRTAANRPTDDLQKDIIRGHIQSFPKVPSHYSRKTSTCDYLAHDLSIKKMYDCYMDYCAENGFPPAKLWMYRNIFTTEYNLKFHKPRKDQCDSCHRFNNSTTEEQQQLRGGYDEHITRKEEAQEYKEKVKALSKSGEIQFIQFDLEAVRYCPSVEAKSIFYKRRLAVYNLTIYNVANSTAVCYMWHEGQAGRGSNEVASCLYDYLKNNANGLPFILMSDTCGGQNRNVNVAAMLLYAVRTLNIPYIEQGFFEPGHSWMECDSVHAHIERHTKHREIYIPSQWYASVKEASHQNKYAVVEVDNNCIYDAKKLAKSTIKNENIDVDNIRVSWLKLSLMQYRADDTDHIYYKYRKPNDFKKIKIIRNKNDKSKAQLDALKLAYIKPIKIKREKASDILSLCKTGIIPTEYHSFFNAICEDDLSECATTSFSDQSA